MESLIERLDTTVLGLVEALDAQSADLPRLLDEALAGSLWARQIAHLDGAESRSKCGFSSVEHSSFGTKQRSSNAKVSSRWEWA